MGGTTNYVALLWLPVQAKSVIRSCAACSEDLTATTHFQVDSYSLELLRNKHGQPAERFTHLAEEPSILKFVKRVIVLKNYKKIL